MLALWMLDFGVFGILGTGVIGRAVRRVHRKYCFLLEFDPLGFLGPAALSFCCFSLFLFLFFGGVGGPAVAGLPGPGVPWGFRGI